MPRDEARVEKELGFLLRLATHFESLRQGNDGELSCSTTEAVQDNWMSSTELEVIKELTLREKNIDCSCPDTQDEARASYLHHVFNAAAESASLPRAYSSSYTSFWLQFYYSDLYGNYPTQVNVTAIRLMQRFLSCSDISMLEVLHEQHGGNMADRLLYGCLGLASSSAGFWEATALTDVMLCVFEGLEYDVQEVTPLEYFEVILPYIPYLSKMCQQASLLLMAHEQLVRSPSSFITLLAILFTVNNIGGCDDVIRRFIHSWPTERQLLFSELNDFLNTFA